MKRRDLERALHRHGCTVVSEQGGHTKWVCPCGRHTAMVPRHTVISAGVVRNIVERMACLSKGWLQ